MLGLPGAIEWLVICALTIVIAGVAVFSMLRRQDPESREENP